MYALNCMSRKSISYRAIGASVSALYIIGAFQSASADPLLLRGDDGTTGFLKGQATIVAPAETPPMNSMMPAVAPAAALGAGAAIMSRQAAPPGPRYQARTPRYDNNHYEQERPYTAVRTPEHRTYFQQHPKVRSALIGAGVGTAAGAVTGLITHKGVFRGAAIGAGAGAGVGLIRSSQTLSRHPIVKDLATGTVAGLGVGLASSHHLGGRAGKLTAVGAALGLGAGVLRDKLR